MFRFNRHVFVALVVLAGVGFTVKNYLLLAGVNPQPIVDASYTSCVKALKQIEVINSLAPQDATNLNNTKTLITNLKTALESSVTDAIKTDATNQAALINTTSPANKNKKVDDWKTAFNTTFNSIPTMSRDVLQALNDSNKGALTDAYINLLNSLSDATISTFLKSKLGVNLVDTTASAKAVADLKGSAGKNIATGRTGSAGTTTRAAAAPKK